MGGKLGHLTVLSTATLQPLVVMKDCVSAIDVIKYSPNNHIMVRRRDPPRRVPRTL